MTAVPTARAATTAAVLFVAVIAAVVSFVHIEHLVAVNGQTQLAAYLLPLSIDGTTELAARPGPGSPAVRRGGPRPAAARPSGDRAMSAWGCDAACQWGLNGGLTACLLSGSRPVV